MADELILGMDLGGTKLAAALVDTKGGMHHHKQMETRASEGAEAIYGRLRALAAEYAAQFPLAAIGVASAGVVDPYTGTAIFAGNLSGWKNIPLATRLKADLQIPAWVDNDVRCMARGELVYGAGRGYRSLLCLTLGTGVGGALIQAGDLYYGARGLAGEIGHTVVDFTERRLCPCGRRGCLEAYVSGPAITNDFRRGISAEQIAAVLHKTPAALTLHDIARLVKQPEAGELHQTAVSVVQQAARRLGWTLGGLINVFDPEAVIIGGGAASVPHLLSWTADAMREQALPGGQDVPLLFAQLGSEAGLIGAAEFARQGLHNQRQAHR